MNKKIKKIKSSIYDRLVIIHWNCNHLPSKVKLLEHFLTKESPDIILLNEIKMDLTQSNFYLDIKNYQSIVKPRDKKGGGVAILVKNGIEFTLDSSFDYFSLELLCIQVKLKDFPLFIFSLYNPPNKPLPFELFCEITKKCPKFLIGGDLNSKTKQIGCIGENENGQLLEKVLNELNVSIINDKSPTFNIFNRQYFEILDIFLTPPSLLDKVVDFKVLNKDDMTSDHFPIRTCLSAQYLEIDKEAQEKLDFKKADWNMFRSILNSNQHQTPENIDEFNDLITKNILEAARKSIPKQSKKSFKSTLPPDIIKLIKMRRKIRRQFKKTQCPQLKTQFNQLTAELRTKLCEFRNNNWLNFIQKMGRNPLSTRPFWRKINKFRSKKNSCFIPTLISNNIFHKTDEEKGKLFGEILASTFSPNSDLKNLSTESEVNSNIKKFLSKKDRNKLFEPINITEIILAINKIKENAAAGQDHIHNLMLKNLPECTLNDIQKLLTRV